MKHDRWLSFALVLVLGVLGAAEPVAPQEPAGPTTDAEIGAAAEGDEAWDVNDPPGDWTTITIDTDETTWPDLDVSPDGQTIVFSMLGDIYSVNVFPNMGVGWDTYPDHIGHEQSDGCLRCHKRSMRTADREQVSNDCETCHIVLAEEEENPDILSVLNPE